MNLKTMFVGVSEPTTMVGGMLWFDTTNNLFKIRNKDNNAWYDYFNQAVKSTSSPTFAGITLTAFTGILKFTAGVGGSGTMDDVPDGATYVKTHNDFTNTFKGYLDQAVKSTSSPLFANILSPFIESSNEILLTSYADAYWLLNWKESKSIAIGAGVGAGTNYQLIFKVYYGSGADGTEVVNGETVGKVYCDSKCKVDFTDVRFVSNTSITPYTHKITSSVASNYAIFVVKVTESLDSARTINMFYGNSTATDVSSDSALVDVITGVAGAWNMEEADAEVSPTVIADDNQAAFWTAGANTTLTDESTIKQTGTNSLKIVVSGGVGSFTHDYGAGAIQNWSAKSLFRFYWYGANSGAALTLKIYNTDQTKYYAYNFTDNFAGWKLFSVPFSSMTNTGTMALNLVRYVAFESLDDANTWYLDRVVIDVGVPAVDYSGNGNNGTATGTTVVAGKFAGKNARAFRVNGDYITIPYSANLDSYNSLSFFVNINILELSRAQHILNKLWASIGGFLMYMDSDKTSYFDIKDSVGTVYGRSIVALTTGQHSLVGTYDKSDKVKLYYDSVVGSNQQSSHGETLILTSTMTLSRNSSAYGNYNLSDAILFKNIVLNQTQINNLNNNYPDVSLETGKVLVRKWATTTIPTYGVWTSRTVVMYIDTTGQLQLPITGNTGGLLLGEDANLYRDGANLLKTDDDFECAINKGLILTDTVLGTRYRVNVTNGLVVAVAL